MAKVLLGLSWKYKPASPSPLGGGSVIKQNLARVIKNAKCFLVQGRKECIQLEAGSGGVVALELELKDE